MTARAGVPESVFSDVFPTVGECYRAAFEEGLELLSRTVGDAAGREGSWLDRLRAGLVAFLGFFDDEPRWGRFLMLETPLDTAVTFACRQRLHGLLTGLLERSADAGEGCASGRAGRPPILVATLTGDLVVGGVFSVIRTSMLEADPGKLVELAPSLMAFMIAPNLGRAAAQAELEGRPAAAGETAAAAETAVAPETAVAERGHARAQAISRASELPIRVTHRTTLVLRAIAHAPYSNNREVAQAAGLADEGQTSKLLTRLERQGVIENVGLGSARGEPNAWALTGSGRRAVELINESFASGAPRQRRAGVRQAP